jgi:hypothetical protein
MQLAGIEMLKPEVAAPLVRQELAQGYSGEVVIAGSLGRLETSQNAESVLNIEKADQALRAGSPIHRMFSRLTDFSPNSGIRLEAELDPAELSYLRDHAINGIPVLPGVMGIEGFSVAAKHIASVLATTGAGFEVEGLEDIQFYAPFKFYGNKPRKITWNAVVYRTEAGMTARVNLESELKRRNGTVDRILHFEGLVLLSTHPMPDQVRAKAPVWSKQKFVSAEDIYKLFFHGPSFQVLEAAQLSESTVLGRFNKHIVGVSVEESDALMAPMLIELCFQTAGLWEAGATGILSLPQSLGSLKLYRQSLNGEAIYAQVNPHECDGKLSFDARVIDAKGNVYLELIDYRTSPMPYSAQKELVEPMKVLVAAQPLQNCN